MSPARRILVINPNSNTQVTEGFSEALESLRITGGPEIECATLADGPFGIETQEHVEQVGLPLRRMVVARPDVDAFVIACYSDPGLHACREATTKPVFGIQESGIFAALSRGDRVGVMVGSGIGGLSTLEQQHTVLMNRGPAKVSPFVIPMMISNIASGMISMEYGFGGPNMAIVTACATSNHSIGEAWRMIKFGDADAFLCGGAEATILPMGLAG